MIKYILRNRIFIYILFASFILGYIAGTNMGGDYESYIATFSYQPIFYAFLVLILFIDFVLSKNYFHTSLIFRYETIVSLFANMLKIELVFNVLIFIFFHLGIGIEKADLLVRIFPIIIKLLINYIIINFLVISIIKIINIKINNQVISTVLLIGGLVIFDIILMLYEMVFHITVEFQSSSIYIIPNITGQSYIFIEFLIFTLALFIMTLSWHLMNRKDYLIKKEYEEN